MRQVGKGVRAVWACCVKQTRDIGKAAIREGRLPGRCR